MNYDIAQDIIEAKAWVGDDTIISGGSCVLLVFVVLLCVYQIPCSWWIDGNNTI